MSEGMQHLHKLTEDALTELAGVEIAICQLTGRQDEMVDMMGEAIEGLGAVPSVGEGGIAAVKADEDNKKCLLCNSIQLYRKKEKGMEMEFPQTGKRLKSKKVEFEPIVVATPPLSSPTRSNPRLAAMRQSLVKARLEKSGGGEGGGAVRLPKIMQ
mmetsp:Transcript_50202/g.129212  ORF Transcript_50202/g.129212 Transcript_50202/m.129212 type:complete len:156 (+) Transcript_50202:1351-1818(+)